MQAEAVVRPELVARLGELARDLQSSPEELAAALAEYERRLAELRALLDPALDALDSGEAEDADVVFGRIEAELLAQIAKESC